MKKNVLFFSLFFIAIIGFITINAFIKSRQEYIGKYDFIINYIDEDAKGDLIFSDSLHHKYSFASYRFNKSDNLKFSIGDKVFKDHYSKNMVFSRRINNKYEIYHLQKPNGIVPFSIYTLALKMADQK